MFSLRFHMEYADDVQMYVSRPLNRISECLDICRMMLAKVNEWAKQRSCHQSVKIKVLNHF